MGDNRTRPEDETLKRPGVLGTPARGAGHQGAAPDEPAAGTPATAHADASSAQLQAGGAVPRLEVCLPPEAEEADEAIAERALQALFSGTPLRRERILMRIARGRVPLSGSVGTESERAAAERLVGGAEGVVEVANLVVVERHGRTTGPAPAMSPRLTAATRRAAMSPAASKRCSCARPGSGRRRS